MIGFFRKLANTAVARVFFFLLAFAFIGWGIAGRQGGGGLLGGDANAVASVDGHSIEASVFQQRYKDDLQQAAQKYPDPSQVPQAVRLRVAGETLDRLIVQQALDDQAHRMGVVAPDAAVSSTIQDMGAFQGIDGKFDHAQYVHVLAQHDLTPQRFQQDIAKDVAKNQILHAVAAGAGPSDLLTNLVFNYYYEQRTADIVLFPTAGRAKPADPGDAVLQRFADNNRERYTSPEYRHIKVVVLSPETIGRTLPVSDAEMKAWFERHKFEYEAPEKRSLQVVTADTQAVADAIAKQWRAGADWAAIEAAATAQKAIATELKDTTKPAIPAPELAQAAFSAAPGSVTGPIKEALGFQIVKVTGITPAKHADFAALSAEIRRKLGTEKAADMVDDRAQKLQDLYAGGNKIDEVPADLGAAAAQGLVDAKGETADGSPAPIPAPDDVKTQILADAFKAPKSDNAQLTEAANHVWYAVAVDKIVPPAPENFATIRARVLADWQAAQMRHAAEADAAKLLAAVKGGQMISAAAWGSGEQVIRTPPLKRNQGARGVPAQLVELIFALKQGEATMTQTESGYLVAQVAQVIKPDPKDASSGQLADIRKGLAQALQDDVLVSYGTAIRDAGKPTENLNLIQKIVAPAQE